jgi:hypothetical protein
VWFVQDPQSLLSTLLDEQGRHLRQSIETLGGKILGIQAEKPPIGGPELHALAWAFPQQRTFAGMNVLQTSVFTSPSKSVYFLTPFKSGEIVFTTNGHYRELESGDLSLRVLKEASPQELLDAHTHRTRAFLETGSRPYESWTQPSRVEATRLFYRNPSIQTLTRSVYRGLVFRQLGQLAVLLVAYMFIRIW